MQGRQVLKCFHGNMPKSKIEQGRLELNESFQDDMVESRIPKFSKLSFEVDG